jgi:hypothetical protein
VKLQEFEDQFVLAPDQFGDLAPSQTVETHPCPGAAGLSTIRLAPWCHHGFNHEAGRHSDVLLAYAAGNLRGLVERPTPNPTFESRIGHNNFQFPSKMFSHRNNKS